MQLKFYLNKFLKVDNIENYTLNSLHELEKIYEDFKDTTEGLDPDFPNINFNSKGKKVTVGENVYALMEANPDSNISIKKDHLLLNDNIGDRKQPSLTSDQLRKKIIGDRKRQNKKK